MATYLVRRFLWIIPVLFVVSLITFALMHAVPGGPWDAEKHLPASTVSLTVRRTSGNTQPMTMTKTSFITVSP